LGRITIIIKKKKRFKYVSFIFEDGLSLSNPVRIESPSSRCRLEQFVYCDGTRKNGSL
jgi:hypothetical protein